MKLLHQEYFNNKFAKIKIHLEKLEEDMKNQVFILSVIFVNNKMDEMQSNTFEMAYKILCSLRNDGKSSLCPILKK
jgi:hypothetical protein